jgi:hypothetical protein
MLISKETFDIEISLCQKMFKKKASCAWGKCENCAVPLLLQKMYKGEIIEKEEAVAEFKANFFR